MVLAMTFSTWYWTKDHVVLDERRPSFVLPQSVCRTFRYHMGTLAYGSLVLPICGIIRTILELLDGSLKKFDNPLTRLMSSCSNCIGWCLVGFLRFLNKNAYIMCAIHGKNLCASGKDALDLVMRNVARVKAVDGVSYKYD